MTDKETTSLLIAMSGDIGEIKGSLVGLNNSIESAIKLHVECPARLGYDTLRDRTSRIKTSNSISPSPTAIKFPSLVMWAPKLVPWILAVLFGCVGLGAYMATGESDASAKAIRAVSDSIVRVQRDIGTIKAEVNALDLDAGR